MSGLLACYRYCRDFKVREGFVSWNGRWHGAFAVDVSKKVWFGFRFVSFVVQILTIQCV